MYTTLKIFLEWSNAEIKAYSELKIFFPTITIMLTDDDRHRRVAA